MSTDATADTILHREFFARLQAPIPPEHVRQRTQAGRTLHYTTARAVMIRLDEVAGPAGWRDEYTETSKGLRCRLWVRTPDGEWTWKEDGGAAAGMAEHDNDEKSAFSDAFKRAGVKWGIARELYGNGVADLSGDDHAHQTQTPAPARGHGGPGWGGAAGRDDRGHRPAANGNGGGGERKQYDPNQAPRSGRALFAWLKDAEQRTGIGVVKYIGTWAKLQDFPGRVVDFDAEQTALAHAEAVRKLGEFAPGDAYEEALAN